MHNSDFYLNNQFVLDSSISTSDSEGGRSSSSRVKKDVNTMISGYYSMAIPVLYFGKKNGESFRFGLGFDPSNVKIFGNVDFADGNPTLKLRE
ncbi:MAG: hypothetical protein KDK36_20410 [Leptospiraceae bacterium]|nr:hypothetical protein [Leptospiraceae bacterium]